MFSLHVFYPEPVCIFIYTKRHTAGGGFLLLCESSLEYKYLRTNTGIQLKYLIPLITDTIRRMCMVQIVGYRSCFNVETRALATRPSVSKPGLEVNSCPELYT